MLSQPKSAVHQQPAKLSSWQIISGAPPLFQMRIHQYVHYDYLFYLSFQLFIELNSGTETSLHQTFLNEPQLS
jgi:hypothetical protein